MGQMQVCCGMMTKVLCLLFCAICLVSTTKVAPRDPKLFYVSTLSTTTTFYTASVCYVTSDSATITACARKRRSVGSRRSLEDSDSSITPSQARDAADMDISEVSLSGEAGKESQDREGRFLVYWMTTTSYSTATSFTTTFSFASMTCTPSSFALTECG